MADDRIKLKDIYRLMWGQSILAGVEDLAADASVVGAHEAEKARVWIDGLRAEFAQGQLRLQIGALFKVDRTSPPSTHLSKIAAFSAKLVQVFINIQEILYLSPHAVLPPPL
ncbi:MAG: hypothetical protein Q9190_003316 [Brigantiaea leucoxantha]